MSFTSYAQNFEDVMLWRALKHIKNGFYIDIGGWSPDVDSVTLAFYENNWSGINIEPNPIFYKEFNEKRTRDINLQVAVAEKAGKLVMNFLDNPGLSTLDDNIAEKHIRDGLKANREEVKVETLDSIWLQYIKPTQDVHFLKIDVEGFELSVIKSNNWKQNRPWILVIEATLPMSQEENYSDWEPLVLKNEYLFAYADGLNRFYVAKEHSELLNAFKYPPNVFDEFVRIDQKNLEYQTHEAQTRANDAENRANEAQARANEAQSKFSTFEVAARLAESRATSAMIELQKTQAEIVVRDRELEKQNIQLKETNEKLADYKRLINNKEQISLELQQQLNRQEQSALELQIKLETAEQDRLNLHEQLDDKEQASLELQKQLEEQEQEAIRLREELADSLESLNLVAKELEDSTKFNEHIRLESQTLSEELAKTRSELHEVHQSNHHHFTESQNLSAELKKTRSELHEVHQSNHHHFTESQNLSAELEKTRSELHEVHQSNHHHFLESQAYKKQLDAMYKSKSWLITTPFRWIGDLIRFLLRLPRLIIVTILRYLIAFLQKPISMLMRWVIGKPKLKARALTTLKRFPGLSHQLRGIAQRYGLIHHQPVVSTESHTAPTETDNNTTPKIEPDSKLMEINHDLSPRAQKIYLDLKQAIEQYKKEGE